VIGKRHTPEEITSKLRQVDVLVSQGQTAADAIRAIGVTEVGRDRKLAPACLDDKPPVPKVLAAASAAWPAVPSRPAPPARHPVAPGPTLN
jgi:hypothetical protein